MRKLNNYVYLAGPMEDLSIKDMVGWRKQVRDVLDDAGIDCLDPTRRVSFHQQLVDLSETDQPMNTCRRIFKQDLQDIADSTVVLADVRRSSGKGMGTSMELMFAHLKNKIIILVADKDDAIHPFLESIYTEKHFTFEAATTAVRAYY